MPTVASLRAQADQALFAERYAEALACYARIVQSQPDDLDARLRIGDALMALGEVQRAAVVYTALSRHAALAGYPLRALVALKILEALEPKLAVLLHDLARLYARDSQRLGRSVRRALPDGSQGLRDGGAAPPTDAELAAFAEQLASRYETAGLVYPEKLIPIPLFSLLDGAEFGAVLSALTLVRARPGATILREGEPGSSFFVLARGQARVSAVRTGEARELARLHEGAIFGEMALLTAAPRTATVSALTDCDLLEFDCGALGDAGATLNNLTNALAGFARERLLQNVAATSPLFRPLDPKQRADLLRRFVAVDAPAQGVVVREGETGNGLYVVLRGEVSVQRGEGAAAIELARLGPGELFGEISLITSEPTTANVIATEASALLFLGRDYFERLVQAVPELGQSLRQLAEDRLMDLRLSADALPAVTLGDDEIDVTIGE